MAAIMVRVAFLGLLLVGLTMTGHLGAAQTPKEEGPRRVNIGEAETLIREHLKLNPQAVVPLRDATTEVMWNKLKVQVFQITKAVDFPNRATVVFKDGKPTTIGRDFGGDGVNALCVADLRGDGKPLLVYSYTYGSGVHYSQVGALDVGGKEPNEYATSQVLVLDFDHDWKVRAVEGKAVRVEGGGVYFGDVMLKDNDLSIRFRDDVPEKVRKNIKSVQR